MANEKDIALQERLNELKARAIELATKERAYTEENARNLTQTAKEYDALLASHDEKISSLVKKGEDMNSKEKGLLKTLQEQAVAFRA